MAWRRGDGVGADMPGGGTGDCLVDDWGGRKEGRERCSKFVVRSYSLAELASAVFNLASHFCSLVRRSRFFQTRGRRRRGGGCSVVPAKNPSTKSKERLGSQKQPLQRAQCAFPLPARSGNLGGGLLMALSDPPSMMARQIATNFSMYLSGIIPRCVSAHCRTIRGFFPGGKFFVASQYPQAHADTHTRAHRVEDDRL